VQLQDLAKLLADPTLADDLQNFPAGLSDPWSE
jgi:hypothetical protein